MKQNVWIWNHYATNTFYDQGGRHFWFAKYLKEEGYNPVIFCASTLHNSQQFIETYDKKYVENSIDGIPYVFIKAPNYKGNGKQRIKNMIAFYKNLFPVSKDYALSYGKPDIILASSAHPLTAIAGIQIAKKFKVECICEVRDLWPESLIAYGFIKEKGILTRALQLGEKWIYKKADKIIFTMEGGKDYVIDKKWDEENGGPIHMGKIFHINNGVDLEIFQQNKLQNIIKDEDLDNKETFKIVYTGSIRLVNNLLPIIQAALLTVKTYVTDFFRALLKL